jgi:hypothetical protein
MQEPTNTDAVLGGKSQQVTSAVLGGIEGARRRLEIAQTFRDRVEASQLLDQYSPGSAIDPVAYHAKLLSKIIRNITKLRTTRFKSLKFLPQGVTGLFFIDDRRFRDNRFSFTITSIEFVCNSSHNEYKLSITDSPEIQKLIKELNEVQDYIHREQIMRFYPGAKDPDTLPGIGDMIGSLEIVTGIDDE